MRRIRANLGARVLVVMGLAGGCANTPKYPEAALLGVIHASPAIPVRLTPAWVGEEREVVRVGSFADHPDRPEHWNGERELRFDLFRYDPNLSQLHVGPEMLGGMKGDDAQTNDYTFRLFLPSNDALGAAKTLSELKILLGPPQGPSDAWGNEEEKHSAAVWRFYRLIDDQAVETMVVFCDITWHRAGGEVSVDGMLVIRGVVRPEMKRTETGE